MTIRSAIAALILAYVLGLAHGRLTPYCPTEDSCTIDYREGSWHIEPTIP
jgi:hypothetical protein